MKTELLDGLIVSKRRKREEIRKKTLKNVLKVLDAAGEKFHLERAYIFGSLIKSGRFNEHSDVDIAVETIAPEHFFKLQSFLEDLLDMDISFVDLRDVHFSEKVRKEGLVWTRKD